MDYFESRDESSSVDSESLEIVLYDEEENDEQKGENRECLYVFIFIYLFFF